MDSEDRSVNVPNGAEAGNVENQKLPNTTI